MKQNLTTAQDLAFNRAIQLRQKGRTEEAVKILQRLRRTDSADAGVCGLLGEIAWSRGQSRQAIQWFEKATKLNPKSELASLGLFHALWEVDKRNQALDEMARFMQIADSEEYKKLLADINAAIES